MIIYPSNIDSNLSRREGRKVARKHAVESPKVQEIAKALGVIAVGDVTVEKEASYPRRPWAQEGRIVIEVKGDKIAMLRRVSKEIRRMRGAY